MRRLIKKRALVRVRGESAVEHLAETNRHSFVPRYCRSDLHDAFDRYLQTTGCNGVAVVTVK